MAIYKCNEFGYIGQNNIVVNAMSLLKTDFFNLDDGSKVQISQCKQNDCSNFDGKIKSPLCCGNDMTCQFS